MSFKVNEKVRFLYETGEGTILEVISSSKFKVLDAIGFERIMQLNEIVKIHQNHVNLENEEALSLIEDKLVAISPIIKKKEKGLNPNEFWEIDLHIEELIDSHVGMSNFEILSKQLKEFKAFYKKAKSKRIRKIVVIHGVGEGVLKEEIRSYLHKQEGIEYYDADYREYGKGATAVELRY